jgi:hypothetical protein
MISGGLGNNGSIRQQETADARSPGPQRAGR